MMSLRFTAIWFLLSLLSLPLVHAESITYISSMAANGQFTLCMAYPTIFPGLMTMLDKYRKQSPLKISLPIIDGYQFEFKLFENLSELHVSYGHQDTPSVQKGEKFKITGRIS